MAIGFIFTYCGIMFASFSHVPQFLGVVGGCGNLPKELLDKIEGAVINDGKLILHLSSPEIVLNYIGLKRVSGEELGLDCSTTWYFNKYSRKVDNLKANLRALDESGIITITDNDDAEQRTLLRTYVNTFQ